MLPASLVALLACATPDLPTSIEVPTPTEAIGIDQLYAVHGGRLYTKRRDQPWTLYDGTGAVPDHPRPIVAVLADERDHFTVVTDDGLLHHHENGAWDSLWGLPQFGPFRAPLALPFPIAALRAGRAAYSMRRDHVLFYEDKLGAQFHWGSVGTTSLYALTEDGARILLADPWLPPDTSREVCGPRRGGVRLASVASSASSLFAIAVDGTPFSTFADYDADGGTPFYRYAYARENPHARAGSDPASELETRVLPLPGWREEPAVPIAGRARLSRMIAILQTGAGNSARLLRIVGDDAHGARGVYEKALDARAWRFRRADVAVPDDAWLDPRADAAITPPAIAMQGALRGATALGWVAARTDDFWFHCSPFSLTLTLDGDDVPLTVHTVDAWTFLAQENVADGEAYKAMKATVTVPRDVVARLSTPARARLAQLFGPLEGPRDEHGAAFGSDLGYPFAFALVANRHELVLTPVGYPWNAGRSRFEIVLRADPRMRARAIAPTRPATAIAEAILADDAALADPWRCGRDRGARAQARAALAAVRAARAELGRRAALTSVLETALPIPLLPVDLVAVLTSARWTLPLMTWLVGFELHAPAVLAAQQMVWQRTERSSADDFDAVERALARCAHAM